ncbi:MAG TPA: hypothetical protein VMF08_18010 [Candidatus Sulfotelmatobacter sp.]|nr:hypothetical protein [Candidatus Sulfotelmatobacter sp.]
MNIQPIRKTLLLAIGGVFVWWAWKSPAQDVSSANANAAMQMPYSVNQVLELEQAKIGDATIIAYIKSSGTSFNLNAAQIVFLRQQGLSDAVITTMLTQSRPNVAGAASAQPDPEPQAPQQYAETPAANTTDPSMISQPPVTYVQTATAPAPYYSYYPYYGYSGYYGYYSWPRLWFPWPFGWAWYGGAWHWGWGGGGEEAGTVVRWVGMGPGVEGGTVEAVGMEAVAGTAD